MHILPLNLLPLLFLAPSIDGWLGIYLDNERTEAVVAEVIPDSPAAKAGLQAGDELLAVGDVKTADQAAFIAAIRAAKPGDRLSIQLRRGGREQVVMVKLGARPEAVATPQPSAQPGRPAKPAPAAESAPVATATVQPAPLPPAAAATGRGYLGISVREDGGNVVVDRVLADGPAVGVLTGGDRIRSVDGVAIGGLADLDRVLSSRGPGSKLELQLHSDRGVRSVFLTLGKRPEAAERGLVSAPVVAVPVAPAAPAKDNELLPAAKPAPASATEPATRPAPKPAADAAPSDAGGRRAAEADAAIEAQLQALRSELAELRRQLEALRRQSGRESGRE
jgi:predicted metalloprotease with PDZ domain